MHRQTSPDGAVSTLCQCLQRALPAYFAWVPSFLLDPQQLIVLAMRSERASEPVLIWPQLVATARSAMVESSVSPERCDITTV